MNEVSIKVAAEVWNEAGEVCEEREEGVKNGWNGRQEGEMGGIGGREKSVSLG